VTPPRGAVHILHALPVPSLSLFRAYAIPISLDSLVALCSNTMTSKWSDELYDYSNTNILHPDIEALDLETGRCINLVGGGIPSPAPPHQAGGGDSPRRRRIRGFHAEGGIPSPCFSPLHQVLGEGTPPPEVLQDM
jgi:hypothetical protein